MDFLLNILSHWESALAVLLVLGGLIFFHELGHFAVARLFRIGVRTFSLGFGPKLLKLRRGKTDYCLSLIPLGGYVALAGEEDEAEQPDPKGKEIDGVLFAPEELYSGRPAWLIGIRASTATGHLPLGPVEAIGAGFRQTWDMIAFTCESFVKLAQRVVPLDNVGGPILIAQMVGQQAEQGLSAVLLLAALISVNLGILNLLPIPILDGGHIVFFTLEMIMGRPVSATAREWSAKVGMALLLGLMILATWNDLTRLFS